MPLYESTFIVRQDVSAQEVDKLAEQYAGIIKSNGGKIVKIENWGLRDLAYIIKKCSKGYYIHLRIDSPFAAVKEMERKLSLNEDIIRFMTFRVEELDSRPSPLIAPDEEGEEIVIGGVEDKEIGKEEEV